MSTEWLGWLASLLVLATFCMQCMVALRLTALASNVAFIAYGAGADIEPVLMLHLLLLPINAWRLAQCRPAGTVFQARRGPTAGPGRSIHRPQPQTPKGERP